MSHINNAGMGGFAGNTLISKTDERNCPPWYAWDGQDAQPMTDDWLWTRSQVSGGDSLGGDGFGILDASRSVYDWDSFVNIPMAGQGQRRQSISGITRNASGAVLGGCVVKLFQTGSDVELGTAVSDPVTGAFNVTSPIDGAACYIVAYLAGSPDVAGTTINTLVVS